MPRILKRAIVSLPRNVPERDYAAMYPYETIKELIEDGLVSWLFTLVFGLRRSTVYIFLTVFMRFAHFALRLYAVL